MPTSTFFASLGLFVVKDFFDAELCARIRSELRVATGSQGRIYKRGAVVTDEKKRRTTRVEVDAPTTSCVEERLRGLKPALESHFHLVLTGCETIFGLQRGRVFSPASRSGPGTGRSTVFARPPGVHGCILERSGRRAWTRRVLRRLLEVVWANRRPALEGVRFPLDRRAGAVGRISLRRSS